MRATADPMNAVAIETVVDPFLANTPGNVHRTQSRPKKCINCTQDATCKGDDETVGRDGETFGEDIFPGLKEIRLVVVASCIGDNTRLDQEADHGHPRPYAIWEPLLSHSVVLREVAIVSSLAGCWFRDGIWGRYI